MSAIATFTLLPKSALPGLRAAAEPKKSWFGGTKDGFNDFLRAHGRAAATYEWSGYVLATLLPYLDEQGIDLMKSEHDDLATHLGKARQSTCFIFTHAHRQAYLTKLVAESYSADALRDYFNEFNGCNEPDIGAAMLDGIRALQGSLQQMDPDSVIFFQIG